MKTTTQVIASFKAAARSMVLTSKVKVRTAVAKDQRRDASWTRTINVAAFKANALVASLNPKYRAACWYLVYTSPARESAVAQGPFLTKNNAETACRRGLRVVRGSECKAQGLMLARGFKARQLFCSF